MITPRGLFWLLVGAAAAVLVVMWDAWRDERRRKQ
jgi:hypothetical protein